MEKPPPFHWGQIGTGCSTNSLSLWPIVHYFSNDNLWQWLCHTGNISNARNMALNYAYILLFCEQLTFSSIIYFNSNNIAQEWDTKICIQTPSVTVLILSECKNSSCEATRTALSRTAPNIINLDLLLPTLCTGSSSLRGDEQHDFYCTNSSEPNSSKQP